MARLEDIPEPTRSAVADIACPSFDTSPFVAGPALSRRRVALVSSAALIRRGDKPFPVGSGEHRAVPDSWPTVSIQLGSPGSRCATTIRTDPSGSYAAVCLLMWMRWCR